MGAVDRVLPLNGIAPAILEFLKGNRESARQTTVSGL